MRKYLRITFTATCLIACLLLLVIWMRSYWWWDNVAWRVTMKQRFLLSSQSGAALLQYDDFTGTSVNLLKWQINSTPSPDRSLFPIGGMEDTIAGFFYHGGSFGFLFCVPYWFLVPLTVAFAAAPWMRWSRRFSLRALLIATAHHCGSARGDCCYCKVMLCKWKRKGDITGCLENRQVPTANATGSGA